MAEASRPSRGHFVRPHGAKAEALAAILQEEAADLLSGKALDNPDGIPEAAILRIICSQALAPTKSASVALAAASKLAEIKGMTGKKADPHELAAEAAKILRAAQDRASSTNLRRVAGS